MSLARVSTPLALGAALPAAPGPGAATTLDFFAAAVLTPVPGAVAEQDGYSFANSAGGAFSANSSVGAPTPSIGVGLNGASVGDTLAFQRLGGGPFTRDACDLAGDPPSAEFIGSDPLTVDIIGYRGAAVTQTYAGLVSPGAPLVFTPGFDPGLTLAVDRLEFKVIVADYGPSMNSGALFFDNIELSEMASVPLPAAAMMLPFGLAGLGALHLRRKARP